MKYLGGWCYARSFSQTIGVDDEACFVIREENTGTEIRTSAKIRVGESGEKDERVRVYANEAGDLRSGVPRRIYRGAAALLESTRRDTRLAERD